MKIQKVVYMAECSTSDWDGDNERRYMGEEYWSVGDHFENMYIEGKVTAIFKDRDDGSVHVQVGMDTVLWIAPHAVQRLYYAKD